MEKKIYVPKKTAKNKILKKVVVVHVPLPKRYNIKKGVQNNKSLKIAVRFFYFFLLFIFFTEIHAQPNDAVVNLDSLHQVISGFGAANILPWRADMTSAERSKAFGTGDGQIGFTILRLRVPNQQSEFSLNLPTAQAAHSLGVRIIASPWSPPAWMKSNNNIVGGRLNDTSYASYAAHLKSFADYMSDNGAPLYAISVQNEPDVNVTYESCDWNASEMLKFVKENAASVGINVIAPESFYFDHALSDPILNDPAAVNNAAIIGGHIYGGGLVPYPLAEQKGKEIWMTEHLSGNTSQGNEWSWAFQVAQEMNDVMQAGMSAYIWWYIVRFYGPISDGERSSGTKGDVTKKGYVMSHFARFIRPGYYRVEATANPQLNVYITAYKDTSKIVIVAVNNGSSSVNQTFTLQNQAVTTAVGFIPYVTSASKNCAQESDIALSNGSFTAALDASSITTFVSEEEPVPVELISFIADADENKVSLSWSTASEKNNLGFELERSSNNKLFCKIAFIKGKGTTTQKQDYTFVDNSPGNKFYYRLKQIDFDGTFKYSQVVEVITAPKTFSLLQNYPNPFNPSTVISYQLPVKINITLKVFDILGRYIATLVNEEKPAGIYKIIFDASGLAGGVYFYSLQAGNVLLTRKFILIK